MSANFAIYKMEEENREHNSKKILKIGFSATNNKHIYIKYKLVPSKMTFIYNKEYDVNELLNESYKNYEYVGETIERKANEISKQISTDKEVVKYLTYMMREIMRNVVEHSNSSNMLLKCRRYSESNLINICVYDNGIGIKKSLNSNPNYSFEEEKYALLMSVQPGVTKAFRKHKKRSNDIWQNSGFGLFMVSSICQKDGCFSIVSGSTGLTISKNNINIDKCTYYDGTKVEIVFNTDGIKSLSNVLKDLSIFGTKIAKSHDINSIKTASHVSTMLINKEY